MEEAVTIPLTVITLMISCWEVKRRYCTGQNRTSGGKAAGTLYGGNDNDSMSGGDDNDTLRGHNGNVCLSGGEGNNTLNGNDGADILTGFHGKDILEEGRKRRRYGADIYGYSSASDSVPL